MNPRAAADLDLLLIKVRQWESAGDHPTVHLLSPTGATIKDGLVTGWEDPAIPDEYHLTLDKGLQSPHSLDPMTRVLILTDLAVVLHRTHLDGWAYGALGWKTLHLAVDGKPRVLMSAWHLARQYGRPPAFAVPAEADWARLQDSNYPTLEADRYRYALLFYRMLVAQSASGRPEPTIRPAELALIGPSCRTAVASMLSRASTLPPGASPPIEEWLRVLSEPRFLAD